MKKEVTKDFVVLAGAIITLLITLIFMPALVFIFGWLGGFLVESFLGDLPTGWLNHLLGTDRFAKGDLAKITAILAVIGMYLKAKVNVKSE